MPDDNPRIFEGANGPPVEDPHAAFTVHINDLFGEATNFLDGQEIASEAEAQAVSRLMDMIRTAARDADKARVAEKKPHDDQAKLVQQKWKPLIDRADLAIDTCKKALAPYLRKVEEAQRQAAENARQAAEAAAQRAREAMQTAAPDNLEARADAEALVAEAKQAGAAANRAEKARPQATGGARATTLRTSYRPELVDGKAALLHYAGAQPDALRAFLQGLAETDVREGKRTIPGFVIHEQKDVV